MKKKSFALLMGILTCAGISIPAMASKQAAKMTCEDFVALDEIARPKVVYFVEGFNRNGKPEDAVIDFDQTDRLVPMVYEECKNNPKHTVLSKVKSVSKKNKG